MGATFHLLLANQEVGAEVHWASEADNGSGGEKARGMLKGSVGDSRCQQLGKAGNSWKSLGMLPILCESPFPSVQGLPLPRASHGDFSFACTWKRDSNLPVSLEFSKDFCKMFYCI